MENGEWKMKNDFHMVRSALGRRWGVIAVLSAMIAVPAFAAVPTTTVVQNTPGIINFQGYLVDPATGKAYADGIYTLDMRLWKSATGTAKEDCVWGAQYSVFVNGGYFNVMLGDANAKDLTAVDGVIPTYGRKELWKATWDGDDRYLGMTPRQDTTGAKLETPVELTPRRLLTAAPFAFRARHAQSADASQADFKVNGKLTVDKATTLKGTIATTSTATQQLGPIRTSSSCVSLTGTSTPSASLPDVYVAGNYISIMAADTMSFASSNGDIVFDVAKNHEVSFYGNGSFVSDVPVNTIGGSGATTIGGDCIILQTNGGTQRYYQDSNTVRIEGGDTFNVYDVTYAEMLASGTSTLSGNPVVIQGTSGKGRLEAASGKVVGTGTAKWGKDSETKYAPFLLRKVIIMMNASTKYAWVDFLSDKTELRDRYKWNVVGYDCIRTTGEPAAPGAVAIREIAGLKNQLYVAKNNVADQFKYALTYSVYVMGVLKTWSEEK